MNVTLKSIKDITHSTRLNRSISQIVYFIMKHLCILISLVALVWSEDSEEREGRQFPQGLPSMGTPQMGSTSMGGTNSSPFSGMNLPSMPNFSQLGVSPNQVPASLQGMQPGSTNFDGMFQKMFSGLMNGGGNPMGSMGGGLSSMLGNMGGGLSGMGGGLPSMGGGLPGMGGGFPGMGGGFPGMGGGLSDMMGGGDMFGGMFGTPTTAPTTTTTTTTTTTAAPQMDPFGMPFGGGMGLTMPFGGGLPGFGSGNMPGFGSGGLPGFGNGMPSFNSLPSMPGLPQLSNPGNSSHGFESFANAVPMFGAFSQQLGRSADEDVAKLKDVTTRMTLAFKTAEKETNLTCQRLEICHAIKEANDYGEVGISSCKPICVAGCKMLSNHNKMDFEPCFKTCVHSEMKENCEVLFPGCERDESYWISLSNQSRNEAKASEKSQENLSKNSSSKNQSNNQEKNSTKSQDRSESARKETDE